MARRVGVCSWSLGARAPEELALGVRSCGMSAVQLALAPIAGGAWSLDATKSALGDAGIAILSGMLAMKGEDYTSIASITATGGVRPDGDWPANLGTAEKVAEIAATLGLRLVTFHAGFVPEEPGNLRQTMLGRLRQIAALFQARNVSVGLETGQESAAGLLAALDELACPNVGVNFDPANMILYGTGNPVIALDTLAPRIMQVHVKDAVASKTRGEWGREVRAGTGEVDWRRFFAVLDRKCPECELVIEREAGDSRVADIKAARMLIASMGR